MSIRNVMVYVMESSKHAFSERFFQRREERLIQYSTGVRSLKWAVSWTFDWSVTFFFWHVNFTPLGKQWAKSEEFLVLDRGALWAPGDLRPSLGQIIAPCLPPCLAEK